MRTARAITLSEKERVALETLRRGKKVAVRLAQRATAVLLAASGVENIAIAAQLGMTRQKAARWRDRYARLGLAGIARDAARPGRRPKLTEAARAAVVQKTLHEKPPAATQWTRTTMAQATGLSASMIGRIWRAHGLKPHLSRTFKLSNDKRFVEKLEDIVGLYLIPPEHAVVFSCDEKSQIQALDRTQPGLPLKRGRAATMTHDYKRNGTTSLFAALNVATGQVIGACMKRHRHQEWIRFLNAVKRAAPKDRPIHLICDNYATHKHANVQAWQKRNPRFHFHFTPTSASWLNMVERFFRDLTVQRIQRGIFRSEAELITAIQEYLVVHNANPKPFIWTASAKDILEKVKAGRTKLDKLRSV